MICSGNEITLLNDYSFLKETDKADDNRWIHLPKMNWKLVEKRIYLSRKYSQHSTYDHSSKENNEFSDDNNITLIETSNEHVFSYSRANKESETLVLANFNDDDQMLYAHLIFAQTEIKTFKMVDQLINKKINPSGVLLMQTLSNSLVKTHNHE